MIDDLVEEVEYLSRWDVGEILKEIGHLVEYRGEYRPADAWGGAPARSSVSGASAMPAKTLPPW